jgi:soluble lytic murein transglycosylase
VLVLAAVLFLLVNVAQYELMRRNHPLEYNDYIVQYAAESNVDAFFIYAIVKTESGFNPDAVSNAGARGLMQIMPDTFEWIRDFVLFESDIEYDAMFIPQDNIRYGAALIAHHLREFKSTDNALAAYHAGRSAVNSWLVNPDHSSDGHTLDNIPIPDTAHYINKVNKAYETYQRLYGGKNG